MLTNALRSLVYELFQETFYKEKKKKIIVFTAFYISHESGVETFIKWFVNNCTKGIY